LQLRPPGRRARRRTRWQRRLREHLLHDRGFRDRGDDLRLALGGLRIRHGRPRHGRRAVLESRGTAQVIHAPLRGAKSLIHNASRIRVRIRVHVRFIHPHRSDRSDAPRRSQASR
jgi:hypothetical protein